MGLAERRARSDFESKRYPALKEEIDRAAGFEVPVEVDWDSLAIEGSAHLYDECFPEIYFKPLIAALRAITVDDMGREALRGGLQKIVIQNKGGVSSCTKVATYKNGTLILDHKPTTNLQESDGRRKAIQKLLEDSL